MTDPEVVDEALERRGPVDLMQVPRLLGNALADIRKLRVGIERLEPHLEDVSRVAHPLRRLGDRRRRDDQ